MAKETIQNISISELHDFPVNPFEVRDDDSMKEITESTRVNSLSPYAKRNKSLYDLKRYAGAVSYLKSNNLKTVSELQNHISELREDNKQIYKSIKDKTQRIDNLNKCFGYTPSYSLSRKGSIY